MSVTLAARLTRHLEKALVCVLTSPGSTPNLLYAVIRYKFFAWINLDYVLVCGE